jgi:hypothetical protein
MFEKTVEFPLEVTGTQSRVHDPTERLADRSKSSAFMPKATSPRPPEVRRSAGFDHEHPASWATGATNHPRGRRARAPGVLQRLERKLRARRHDEVRDELAGAELSGELSEFHALNFQAILAVDEGSAFAGEYLELAEAVASTPFERAVIAETRAAYDLRQGNPIAAAQRCLATLEYVHQTEGLWLHLLLALSRLGEVETIDAALRRFTELNDECTARLVGVLSSAPGLGDIRARPAFQRLLAAAG